MSRWLNADAIHADAREMCLFMVATRPEREALTEQIETFFDEPRPRGWWMRYANCTVGWWLRECGVEGAANA